VNIRPGRPGEEAELTELAIRSKGHWGHDAAFLERSRTALTLHPGDIGRLDVRVAERDGVLAGFSAVGDGELELLFVDPPAIGTGVGAALLRDVLARHSPLVIESDPDAEPFYLRFGAEKIGTRVSTATGRELPLLRISAPAPRRGE
jgi:GNAT superfamily N-acetyltransferase